MRILGHDKRGNLIFSTVATEDLECLVALCFCSCGNDMFPVCACRTRVSRTVAD